MTKKSAFVAIVLFASLVALGNAADLHAPFERAATKEFGVPLEIVQGVAYVSSGGV